MRLRTTLLIIVGVLLYFNGFSQSGLCTPNTPFYTVNLTADSAGLWKSSPPIVRQGDCCGSSWPDRCIEFEITLHPSTVAINFEILSGAVPGGAMFYQIGCGPLTKVGDPICVDGPGPHVLTFCKPGSNLNTYGITAIPGPSASPDTKTSEGCTTTLYTNGITNITWKDITSADERYNSYLSCITAECDSVLVTPQAGYPAFVDYQVCGTPTLGPCYPFPQFCDTVRVNFVPPLLDSIYPNPAVYCETETGIMLTGKIGGGQAPYTFIWTDQAGTLLGNDSGYYAAEGSYNLEIRDALYPNCPAKFLTGTVSKELSPIAAAGPDITVCASNPTINLAGSVTNSNTYYWAGNGNFGSATSSLTNSYTPSAAEITAGQAIITLTAEGISACDPAVDSLIITINPAIQLNLNYPSLVCYQETANITMSISGGTPAYNILWSNAATSTNLTGVSAGVYSVTVTDQSGNTCSETATATINENPELFLTVPPLTTIICDSSTSVTGTASGGNGGPYNYLWSSGNTNNTVSLLVGSYTLQASDGNACSISKAVEIDATNSDLAVSFPVIPNTCYGGTATISPTVSQGFSPYTYLWGDNSIGTSRTVSPGTYCVEITDSAGCKRSACTTVGEDSIITIAIDAPALICFDSSATITARASGGTAPYTYSWSSGESDSSVTKIAGNYTVTVTDANPNGCNQSIAHTLPENTQLALSLSTQAVACYGENNGTASIAVTGGSNPYTYNWSCGGTGTTSCNVSSGDISVLVTDSLGCTDRDTVTIIQPDTLITTIASWDSVACYGQATGQATLNVVGGNGGYQYNWNPSGENGSSATSLPAGLNVVTVTDAKGCTDTAQVIIPQPDSLIVTLTTSSISCKNANDGSITPIVNGGSFPYDFTWIHDLRKDSVATALSPGNYQVTVVDGKGCVVQESASITEPDSLKFTFSAIDSSSCFQTADGSASATVTGGTTPYTFAWSDGQSSSTASNLIAGNYSLTVSDSNNCQFSENLTILEPDELLLDISPNAVISCDSSASIIVTATGGTPTYNYSWNTGGTSSTLVVNSSGTYQVQVTDVNGCQKDTSSNILPLNSTLSVSINGAPNICFGTQTSLSAIVTPGDPPYSFSWSNGSSDSIITVGPGSYCATVVDSGGCDFTACHLITEQPLLTVTVPNDTACLGGKVTLSTAVSGGLAPYTYSWSQGGTDSSKVVSKGTYTINVSDSIGCQAVDTASVVELAPIIISFPTFQSETCIGANDGYINSSVTGGLSPYSYKWTTTGDSTANIYNVSSGSYSLTVTDALGCQAAGSITIIGPTDTLKGSFIGKDITCQGLTDGQGMIQGTGGITPYRYFWWETNDTVQSVSGLSAGTYTVSLQDSLGCIVTDSITISQPDTFTLALDSVQNVLCFGESSGRIKANVSGGTSPYGYTWDNGSTNNMVSNFSAGSHSVTVTDKNGCQLTDTIALTQPDQLLTTVSSTDYIKCDSTAVIFVVANGGTGNYSYNWGIGGTTDTIQVTGSGNYIVTVTDSNNCEAFDTAKVIPLASTLEVNIIGDSAICQGDSSLLSLAISPGIAPYNFTWSNGDTSNNIFSYGGTECVTITDQVQCVFTDCHTVNQSLNFNVAVSDDTTCFQAQKTIVAEITGGRTPYNTMWNTGDTSAIISKEAGTYNVTVTDKYGCMISDTVELTENAEITVSNQITDIACLGDQDGAISISYQGGSVPLSLLWGHTISPDTLISNLSAGNYDLTITDNLGCKKSDTLTVNQPTDSLIITSLKENLSCYKSNNGKAEVQINGGGSPYQVLWLDNSSTSPSRSNLSIGTYTYQVTDAFGCVKSNSTTLTQPDSIILVLDSLRDVLCFGAVNGRASASVQGGTLPYNYVWDNGNTNQTTNNLGKGEHYITVTDKNNCLVSDTFSLNQPTAVVTTVSSANYITCDSTATIFVVADGGVGGFTYQWGYGGTEDTVLVTGSGSYDVTVTDSNGCEAFDTAYVYPINSALQAEIQGNTTLCEGDSTYLTLSITPGIAPFNVLWGNGDTTLGTWSMGGSSCVTVTDASSCIYTDCHTVNVSRNLQVSTPNDSVCYGTLGYLVPNITGGIAPFETNWSDGQTSANIQASEGEYILEVVDNYGCKTYDTSYVEETNEIIIAAQQQNIICFGANNGSLDISISGGTQPYDLDWSHTINSDTTQNNLSAGVYTLTVTDAIACAKTNNYIITEPSDSLLLTMSSLNVNCKNLNDGQAEVLTSGGISPYNIAWAHNGSTNSLQKNLSPGIYEVTVADSLGCTRSDSVTITEPETLIANITSTVDVLCFGDYTGNSVASATGGTAPYKYLWTNGQTAATASKIEAGEHIVKITDFNGCEASDTTFINQPTSIITSASSSAGITCDSAATIYVVASGGVGNYTYLWGTGATQDTTQVNGSGNYIVTVKDGNNCEVMDTAIVTPIGTALSVQIVGDSTICDGDSSLLSLLISPASSNYNVLWDSGESSSTIYSNGGSHCVTVTDSVNCKFTDCHVVNQSVNLNVTVPNDTVCYNEPGTLIADIEGGKSPFSVNWSSGETGNSIQKSGGTYTATVTDAYGCTISNAGSVYENNEINISHYQTNNKCYGESKGRLDVLISGGVSPFNIEWNHSITQGTSVSNLPSGTYIFSIEDVYGCAAEKTFVITQPASAISINLDETNPNCFSSCDGTISSTVSGGTLPYVYNWSSGSTNTSVNNLCAGNYQLTVSDDNNCVTQSEIIILNEPTPIKLGIPARTNSSCFNSCDGTISFLNSNASSFSVDGGKTYSPNPNFTGLCAGDYDLLVSDNNGCTDETKIKITAPAQLFINGPNDTTICYGNTITLSASSSGGSGNKNYIWSTGETSNVISMQIDTTSQFYVQSTDANGCKSDSANFTVYVRDALSSTLTAMHKICAGEVKELTASGSGGNGNYTYTWTSIPSGYNGSGPSISVSPTGNMEYVVTIDDGCTETPAKDTALIEVEKIDQVDFEINLTSNCLPTIAEFVPTNIDSNTFYTYLWTIGDIKYSSEQFPSQAFQEAGAHDVKLEITSESGCKNSIFKEDAVLLDANPVAQFYIEPPIAYISNPYFEFINTSANFNYQTWDKDYLGSSISYNDFEKIDSIGCFPIGLTVWNVNGCRDSTVQEVCVIDEYRFFAPSAFSPNDDGDNDVYVTRWHLMDIDKFEFWVYDRWGLEIFHTTDPYDYWNGSIHNNGETVQIDVYVWKAITYDEYGDKYQYVGTVTVVR